MGLINNLMDRFKNAEFTVAPQKKLKTISRTDQGQERQEPCSQ